MSPFTGKLRVTLIKAVVKARDGLKNLLILNKNSVNKSRPGPRMD